MLSGPLLTELLCYLSLVDSRAGDGAQRSITCDLYLGEVGQLTIDRTDHGLFMRGGGLASGGQSQQDNP